MKRTFHSFRTVLMPCVLLFLLFYSLEVSADTEPESDTPAPALQKITAVDRCDIPPTYFLDTKTNRPAGFFVDVMNDIAERAGLQVDYICGEDWPDVINKLETGKADIAAMTIGEKREQNLKFSSPIEISYLSFFGRSQSSLDINRIPRGYTVGVVKQSVAFDAIKDLPGVNIIKYDSYQQGLFALFAGQIDLLAGPESTIFELARLAGLESYIKMGKSFSQANRSIAVRKDNLQLLWKLNKALEGFVGGPKYQSIYIKWYGKPSPDWTLQRIVMISVSLLFITVCVMSLWRRRSIVKLNKEIMNNRAEQKRIEENMRLQAEIYQNIAEGIVLTLKDGTIVFTNSTFDKMFGYEEGDLKGKNLSVTSAGNDNNEAEVSAEIEDCLNKQGIWQGELYNRKKDGTYFWCQVNISKYNHSVHGKVWVATYMDITERKRAERSLQKSEKELKDITSSLAEGIYVMNADGRITFVNSEAERILGWTARELADKNIHDVIHSRRVDGASLTFEECPIHNIVRTGKRYYSNNESFIRKDGTSFPVSVLSSPLIEKGKVVASVTAFRDITERKRLEREVAEISTEERRHIGHELHDGIGQILTGISFMCKAIEKKLIEKHIPEYKDIQRIKESAGEALQKARDISKVLSTEIEASGIAVALQQVAEKTRTIYNVKCAVSVSGDMKIRSNMVAEQLYYIAAEAMTNAAKHSKAETIATILECTDGKIKLTVEDNGKGFDRGPDYNNGGMGLPIMKHRAGIIGAHLNISQIKDGGTVVECTLSQ